MASFRSLLNQVLHLHESPHRTALAFAIGTWIAFSPFYGFHIALVGLCTWLFGLNFIALLAGAFLNNPWTIVPILGATYWTGALILGRREPPSFNWDDLSFGAIYNQVMPYALPFTFGGLILSCIGGVVAYPLAFYFIKKYRRAHPIKTTAPLPPDNQVG